jgi:hypothetical protein
MHLRLHWVLTTNGEAQSKIGDKRAAAQNKALSAPAQKRWFWGGRRPLLSRLAQH